MSTVTEFSKFIKRMMSRVDSSVTQAELEDLLFLGEDAYERDNPRSVSKHLRLNSVEFSGVKSDGQALHYTKQLHPGLNLWVGDNLVGKSSIFKVIKFAIAGRDDLAKDVSSWLREAWVEFTIGAKTYTSHIYKGEEDKHYTFDFYSVSRAELADFDEAEAISVREHHAGVGSYETFLETFFFREFNYYNMLWTAKKSGKGDSGLNTAKASWNTYFKSIYLEAEDYKSLMYGSQAELIFQMLLGLSYTYPINRLKIKADKAMSALGQFGNSTAVEVDPAKYQQVKHNLSKVEGQIQQSEALLQRITTRPSGDNEKNLEVASNKYSTAALRLGQLNVDISQLQIKKGELEKARLELRKKIRDYGNDIIQKKKLVRDLSDYEQFGAFFNALQVKTCPSCSHEVERVMVQQEQEHGTCRLCSHEVARQTVEPGTYTAQIARLEDQSTKLRSDQYNYEVSFRQVEKDLKQAEQELEDKQQQLRGISLISLQREVESLKQLVVVKPIVFDFVKHTTDYSQLKLKQAELLRELAELAKPASPADTTQALLTRQLELLKIAQEELAKMREEKSKDLLAKLTDLYLYYLKTFGLVDYQKVEIDEKFKFTYYKADTDYSFDELTAGEQLRAKLGLYIALIQLDVQYRYGRHPRFIILDSPAKEEGDPTFVAALKDTLSYIEKNMQQDLQVFVGTAVRTLAPAVAAEKLDLRAKAGEDGKKHYFF